MRLRPKNPKNSMSTLFEQMNIGSMAARNRLVRAATYESLAKGDGAPSDELVDLYARLAEGGVGTIVTGYAYVCPDGKPNANALSFCDESNADSYRPLIGAAHRGGARIVAQLVYGGSKSKLAPDDPRRVDVARQISPAGGAGASSPPPNCRIAGPSPVEHPSTGLVPYEASCDDIARIVSDFAEAAFRAQRFGFDGVEIHAAHGYLLGQFLSPAFNRRTDAYGGPLANRARLACECVATARAELGPSFPIIVKLNSSDSRDGANGLTEGESMQAASLLASAGASAIEVSGDWHAFSGCDAARGPFFGDFGSRMADELDIPVIVTGGWRDPRVISSYLERSRIAAVGLCRPFICEPDLAGRWESGDLEPSRCTSCNHCCTLPGIPCLLAKR